MCGIFGFIVAPDAKLQSQSSVSLLKKLCLLSETRGKDASGLMVASTDKVHVLKRPFRAKKLLKSEEFDSFAIEMSVAAESTAPYVVMGHTRMVTNGKAETHENNQPTIAGNMICIHNGIVVNDRIIWENHPELERKYEIDTEVILSLTRQNYHSLGTFVPAVQATFREINGANSVAILPSETHYLVLATSNGSLFSATSTDGSIVVFTSEKYILDQILEQRDLKNKFPKTSGNQLLPGTGIALDLSEESITIQNFSFIKPISKKNFAAIPKKRSVTDIRPLKNQKAPFVADSSYTELEKLCVFDIQRIISLKRCTRCILPETFPFIEFDDSGVCNYCHRYIPRKNKGVEPLHQLLDTVRKHDGSPDCLVPMSGGRDSCYALHCTIKELGMKPVAYTYDWGMVTDLARRNISRMCGALGVEHILVSSDIVQKRANIRQNVIAWLKKPHLGTITLFMAGDKPYFYYAYMLRRQMNLELSLLGANELENSGFKIGFCDIEEKSKDKKHYQLSTINKIQLLTFFGKRFMENLGYFNKSLLDTLKGFTAYYILPTDYVSLYDYILWDEETVNNTLLNHYDWETAPDTKTTWRIGDGTAPFYNYIYYKIAGFSENDTFRSNQIREGLLDRETAWEIALADNQPRIESLKWYCDTVGIDGCQAIKRINKIPTLY